MIALPTLAAVTGLGAVVGLDAVSFPQAMVSRPIVAATLAGAICGDAPAGLLVGVLLECFALETMPFGASRYPEWGTASVVAGMLVALPDGLGDLTRRVAPFAVLAGLMAAMLSGLTLVWLRRFNAAWATRLRAAIAAGEPSAILGLQRVGLVADLVRGGLVTLVFALALGPVRDAVLAHAGVFGIPGIAFAAVISVGVAGGAFWKVVHSTKGYAWWLLAGIVAGLAIVVAR